MPRNKKLNIKQINKIAQSNNLLMRSMSNLVELDNESYSIYTFWNGVFGKEGGYIANDKRGIRLASTTLVVPGTEAYPYQGYKFGLLFNSAEANVFDVKRNDANTNALTKKQAIIDNSKVDMSEKLSELAKYLKKPDKKEMNEVSADLPLKSLAGVFIDLPFNHWPPRGGLFASQKYIAFSRDFHMKCMKGQIVRKMYLEAYNIDIPVILLDTTNSALYDMTMNPDPEQACKQLWDNFKPLTKGEKMPEAISKALSSNLFKMTKEQRAIFNQFKGFMNSIRLKERDINKKLDGNIAKVAKISEKVKRAAASDKLGKI